MIEPSELKQLKELSKKLEIEFKDFELLREALTHRSMLNEIKDNSRSSNERLEFLGDAVLELISTEYLFKQFPNRPEGDLTSFRAAVVRTESLAETALELEYSKYLYMSKGEEATGGRERPYILANSFESVLGAIYIDQGYEVSKAFVVKTLLYKLDTIVQKRLDIDSKSKLQEIAQELLKQTPTYEVIEEKGPDHDKEFKIQVLIGEEKFGEGIGRSKQEAEQNAAKQALENKLKRSGDN